MCFNVDSQEAQLYNHQHTKTILIEEKKVIYDKLTTTEGENQVSDRIIRQNQLAAGKKADDLKALQEIRDELDKELDTLNKSIFDKSIILQRDIAKFKDEDLLKDATTETMLKRQEANKATIQISIKKSQI